MINMPNKGEHPIETGNYYICTKQIRDLYSVILRWINNRSPGGIIYGRPRLGKTRAVGFIKNSLEKEFGENLPIFIIYCCQHNRPNENRFYTEILRDIGHNAYDKGKAEAKKVRIIKYFIERAQYSGTNKVILFIDEAQMLFEQEYNWLIDIYNQLDRYFIDMVVILVGQEELLYQKSAFIKLRKMQIIGRFMVHEYKFSGIKSINELEVCLESYDIYSEYPVGSGWSYTKYFFSEAYIEGKRLKDDAELIYSLFENSLKEANLKRSLEIPMQYLTSTIDYCMTTFGINGKERYWPTTQDWKNSIKNSGYTKAEMYNSMF